MECRTGCCHCLCPTCPDCSKVGGWPEEQHAGGATEGLALWEQRRGASDLKQINWKSRSIHLGMRCKITYSYNYTYVIYIYIHIIIIYYHIYIHIIICIYISYSYIMYMYIYIHMIMYVYIYIHIIMHE